MQEDIKVVVTADTATAEKQIDKLDEKEIKIKTDIKVPKDPLKEVKEEADILGKRVANIKLNKKAFSKDDIKILKAEIEATALKAKSIYFGEGSKSAKELSDRLKDMHKALGEGKKQAKETNQIFGSMDIMIGSLKAKIVASVVNTLKQGVVEGSKLAGQLEYAVEKTRTISSSNRGIIGGEVERIGKKFGTDYREVSEGLYQVVSAIGDVHKKYALLETANKLAITGFSSVNESVDGLTTVLNAYNLEIEEAERVANVFVRTQKVGKLTVQEFQQQLYKTVPTAKELGITIEEIGASIALLTAKGSKAEVAQTQMGAFMYELLDTGSEVNKLFAKLKGQSIETFMKSGGNLEGILKTLKNYSNQSGFKIESLFGRKEAKSFWLNLGNDINGYIEKLKAINSPVNELDRNVDNLMATMEKRIERGSKYWDSLKRTIGESALEILASIGDIATGHDKEAAARKKMNIEMENSLKTLEELGTKSNKTKEEQEKLNEALKVLEILAPEIAEAYKKWSIEGGNYADVLSLIKQRQTEVNNSFKEISYKEARGEKEKLEKEIKRLEEKEIVLGRKNMGFGVQETITVKELEANPAGLEMQRLKEKGFDYASQAQNEVMRLKNLREQLEETEKNLIAKEKDIENFGKNTDDDKTDKKTNEIAPKQPVIPGRTLTDDREFKNEQEIENDINRALIKAQKVYSDKLNKLSPTDFTGKERLDSSYRNEVESIKNKGQIEQYRRERNDLQRSILTEIDDTKVKTTQDKIDKLSLKIQDLEGQVGISDTENRIDNAKKAVEEKKKAEEEAKKEVDKRYKEEQLKVDTEYNTKMLKATEEYNKAMADLKGQGTKEEIEAVKKAYEEAKREAETEKKIGTLKNKKDNTYYSTDKEKKANTEAIVAEISLTEANAEKEKADKDAKDAQDKNTEAINKMSTNLRNLAGLFQAIGDNTNSTAVKNIANGLNIGSTIFDTLKGTEQGKKLIGDVLGSGAIPGFENFSMGAGIGGAISGALGGGAEGNIGSTVGALAGTFIPIPGVGQAAGSIIGGALGSIGGSLFGRSKKKKAKREARKRKAAQERLKKGLISGQFKWQDVVEEYNEELAKQGMGSYLGMYDKVSANTSYDNVLSSLEGAKVGKDGVSMSTLKQLMPQYNEQELIDWFKSLTGGAVLNGDTLSTGEGKYGAIDITALAQQVTNANRELEKSLKETIKNIIDFSADSLASVVKNGFVDGLDDLGDNIEKMVANSLKNAFINTEISKSLFNGLSDKVDDYVEDMFKADGNLGIDLETGNLEDLTLTQYIDLIKKYMEMSNDKLEDLFKELGMNMDNLTNSMDTLNKNMSKNVVTGIATNLWKQNLGLKEPVRIENNQTIEIPVMLNGKEMDRYIIKTVNNSMQRSRRSGNGIGRG
ncbi:phage tail tape measure protein [Fusobacterium ulcerans]|uniref:phage tail tape measure protein n=1 Tax=Fusobacterium ulcerans TaxID=861 RepID=UPI002673BA66|nr:phage tail tape measure protein [Fusobacterium ulcerans]